MTLLSAYISTNKSVGEIASLAGLSVADLHDAIPYDCVPIAVDLVDDAEPLPLFHHPERAFYIFGPEDGTLGKSVLSWCARRVMIPTTGCLNLAMCVNTVLYDRLAKQWSLKCKS